MVKKYLHFPYIVSVVIVGIIVVLILNAGNTGAKVGDSKGAIAGKAYDYENKYGDVAYPEDPKGNIRPEEEIEGVSTDETCVCNVNSKWLTKLGYDYYNRYNRPINRYNRPIYLLPDLQNLPFPTVISCGTKIGYFNLNNGICRSTSLRCEYNELVVIMCDQGRLQVTGSNGDPCAGFCY